ncbi:Nrap protein [Punctularia strigosozonata HHB-11173 SS5]|uniref:Nrap protein n=1 Tax=Punctularia strigosozonata (strain HHB-11173) TaxID=741275 RepID=UPI0004417ABD|nr:Nrap protein [Punctularia strigosozonata HHB-11173 SS5]EIN13041.1 Nrap protein [Punctularia strigosozonata HHB-11173 SS5]
MKGKGKVYQPPTGEEVTQIKDATSLYRSASFKLQIDALLPTIRPKPSHTAPLERFLLALHTFLTSLPPLPETHPRQAADALSAATSAPSKKKRRKSEGPPPAPPSTVHIPYPQPLPPHDTKWKVSFEPPEATGVLLTGSWADGLSVKGLTDKHGGTEGARFSVDVAVEMPDSLFQEKDYLDNRFFHKRAFFLARIAAALAQQESSPGFNVDAYYASAENDVRRTILVLRHRQDGSATDFSKLHAEVRIIPTLGVSAPISLHRLSPSHANLRISSSSDSSPQTTPEPTPLYNSTLLLSYTPRRYLLATHTLVQNAPAYKDALALLRIWANQRGFASVSPASPSSSTDALCVDGFETKGPWWNALLELVVNGEEPTSATGLKRKTIGSRRALGKGLSSYQLFRAVLDVLSRHDFVKEPVFVKTQNGHRYPPEEYSAHHDAVFVDSSSLVNLLAGTPLGSLDLLRHDAKITLDRIDSSSATDDPFPDVFLHDHRSLQTRFDTVIRVDLSASPIRSPSVHATLEHGSVWKATTSVLVATLREGLGNRAKVTTLLHPSVSSLRSTSVPSLPPIPPVVFIGLVLDPEHAFRLVDHGPAAEEGDTPELTAFRKLWGPKAELRRFKDGRITESVVWEVRTAEERARVPALIVEHLLWHHFDIQKEQLKSWIAGYDELLRMPKEIAALHPGQATGGFKAAMAAFDGLVKTLKSLDDQLPLGVTTLSPVSEYLRYTSPFAPVPLPATGASVLPECARYLPTMDVVLEFEKSGRWPDDLQAIQKVKLAFFETLANAYMIVEPGSRAQIVLDDHETDIEDHTRLEIVTAGGWAFSLRIWHDREATLLDRILEDRTYITQAAARGDASPKEKKEAAAAKELYNRRFIHAPRHHRAIAALCHRFTAFAGSVRLVKRWLASHWLAHGHISTEAIELLCAAVFLKHGASAAPGSKECGFANVVELLRDWRWEEAMVVPLYAADSDVPKQPDVPPAPTSSQHSVWRIFTEADPGGLMWTGMGPGLVVARRVKALAAATFDLMNGMVMDSFVPNNLFRHPTEDYDFVVELDAAVLPRYHQNVSADPRKWARKGKYANMSNTESDDGPLRPGFDPAQLFFDDLQRIYKDTFLLFWDPLGGDKFGGVWDPTLKAPRPFRVLGGFSSAPAQVAQAKGKDKDAVVLNEPGVLAEIERMGQTIVKRIVVQV